MNCYCCSGKPFGACCGPYINEAQLPETAEQLMRSRYSAFVLANETYLRSSWGAEYCPQNLNLDAQTQWLGLEVIWADKGGLVDQTGQVEFKARFIQDDKLVCIHEKSDFQREKGVWKYLRGKQFDEPVVMLSMNQSCPCGSGKKYKRCCKSD